jgi:hypothetical protein
MGVSRVNHGKTPSLRLDARLFTFAVSRRLFASFLAKSGLMKGIFKSGNDDASGVPLNHTGEWPNLAELFDVRRKETDCKFACRRGAAYCVRLHARAQVSLRGTFTP